MKIKALSPDKSILKELGARLARVRKQQGYSQDRLAKEAGLGVATLRRIEDGQDSQLGSWLKLLKALQMTSAIDQLMPENFKSPMAEVKDQQKSQKKHDAGIVWGDES